MMRPPSTISLLRRIHTATSACNLVAPPDPMSNMRPIIYSDVSPSAPEPRTHHPYSLSEFTPEDSNGGKQLELQFKLQRQHLDEFHHNFWFDSNSRFEAAKRAVLSSLPSTAAAIDKEDALSEFYKHWYIQEAVHTDNYTTEWRAQNLSLIRLAARIEYDSITHRFSHLFSFWSRRTGT